MRVSRRNLLLSFALSAVAGGGYSFLVEPNWLRIRRYDLTSPKWPDQFEPLKIVFATDFHVGCPSVGLEETHAIVKTINALKPDIVLLGGDFLISGVLLGTKIKPAPIAAILGQLHARHGVYSVLGNHDWWEDGEGMRRSLEAQNIKVLENDTRRIERDGGSFWLAGLADDTTRHPDLEKTMAQIDNSAPVIMLAHDPACFLTMGDRPVVTLCGHTHGGQIVIPYVMPLVIPGRAPRKYAYGHIQEQGRDLIVSSGIGTSILPARFGRRPEIVEINIRGEGRVSLT